MKKSSKTVTLVLISATLASCAKVSKEEERQRVFMRADNSAPYTEVTDQYEQQRRSGGMGMGSALLWYMAFRPMMGGGMGYTSNGISPQSNIGKNTAKANAVKTQKTARGGFGTTAKSQSASS